MSFGRSDEEKMKLEEERLYKVMHKGGSSAEQPKKKESTPLDVSKLDPEVAKKVAAAQAFLASKPPSASTVTYETPLQVKTPSEPLTDRKVLTFHLSAKKESNRTAVEVQVEHSLQNVTLTPLGSIWDEEISLYFKGSEVRVESKHKEVTQEGAKTITETVTRSKTIDFPYLVVSDVLIKPLPQEGLQIIIPKPSF